MPKVGPAVILLLTKDRKDSGWSNDSLPSKIVSFMVPINNSLMRNKEIEIIDRCQFIKKVENSLLKLI